MTIVRLMEFTLVNHSLACSFLQRITLELTRRRDFIQASPHPSGQCDARTPKVFGFHEDLLYPFCRRLEFCMLLNSGYLA
jgi:hypothetical protein